MGKVKYFHLWGKTKAKDGEDHYVTVEFKPGHFTNGELKYSIKKLNRKLTLGVSICHPLDEFDEEIGCELAKARIENGQDLGIIETSDVTMLTEDAILSELLTKLQYILANIDDYIS